MNIENEQGVTVPTYGGPFDSYTIPFKDEDGNYTCSWYCHDIGLWQGETTIYKTE